jgi:hypothetical protein
MLLFGRRCAGQEVIENMVVALSRGNRGDSATFEPVV